MNTSDAAGILGINSSKEESSNIFSGLTDVDKKKKRTDPQLKKPEGMHRELFNLLDRQGNIASLIPSSTKDNGYRNQKAKIGMNKVRPWLWYPFENIARADGLRLYHWQRKDKIECAQEYPFAKFNKVINVPEFSDEEYDKFLISTRWTKEDTMHLFELCRRFDLRWPVIVDRWEGSVKKSMEEIKERFYNTVNELNTVRNESCEMLCYDAEHEKRRKEQLIKLWNRSEKEIEEEEQLLAELKKIEIRKRERERKAQDLQKLITASERAPSSPANSSMVHSPSTIIKKKSAFRPKASIAGSHSTSTAFITEQHSTLRFAEFRSAGAHLRSQEMKMPTNIGQKKLKNIETVIEKLKLDLLPVGAEEIVTGYNKFRSSIVFLQELKHMLQTAEYELESLRNRYNALTGMTFDIEPCMRASSSTMPDSSSSSVGSPSSNRLIADMIELTSTMVQLTRKRKATVTPYAAVDARRSRRI